MSLFLSFLPKPAPTPSKAYVIANTTRNITLKGEKNNNKMERLNGEIRDREKVVRGLKKAESPLLSGYQIYHNYVRPHMSLNGETPADRAGIKIQGNDKWRTLIENASL